MAPETVPVEDIKEHLTLVKFIACNVILFNVCMHNIINLFFQFSIFAHILFQSLEVSPQFQFFFALFISFELQRRSLHESLGFLAKYVQVQVQSVIIKYLKKYIIFGKSKLLMHYSFFDPILFAYSDFHSP